MRPPSLHITAGTKTVARVIVVCGEWDFVLGHYPSFRAAAVALRELEDMRGADAQAVPA